MFSSFLALMERYPGAWSFIGPILLGILWAVVSGIFNALYDRFSPHSDPEWAAALMKHPTWAAIVSAFKTGGFNLPGLLRSLRMLFAKKVPSPIANAMSSTRPPTVREMREAMLEVLREEQRVAMDRAVEKYAAPVVLIPTVEETAPGPDLGAVTGGFMPPRPGDTDLPEPPKDAA
jgi:hypothetical protein